MRRVSAVLLSGLLLAMTAQADLLYLTFEGNVYWATNESNVPVPVSYTFAVDFGADGYESYSGYHFVMEDGVFEYNLDWLSGTSSVDHFYAELVSGGHFSVDGSNGNDYEWYQYYGYTNSYQYLWFGSTYDEGTEFVLRSGTENHWVALYSLGAYGETNLSIGRHFSGSEGSAAGMAYSSLTLTNISTSAAVPEPGMAGLCVVGLLSLFGFGIYRRKNR